jgi:anti-sigma-K factor RskA
MTRRLSHDEAQSLLAAEALDALTGEERDALPAHTADCAECRARLSELRDTAAALAFAAPPAAIDVTRRARIRERLLARAAAERTGPGGTLGGETIARRPETRSLTLRRTRTPWLMAAAFGALMVGAGIYAFVLRRDVRELEREIATLESARVNLQRDISAREGMIAGLTGPSVRVVDLAAGGARPPSGRMFWDQATDTWTFFAHNLPPNEPGRTYQLWLITPGERTLPAGLFVPDPAGRASVQATFALPPDSLAAVAVSEEPAGGVPKPTGEIVLLGKVVQSE